MERLVDLPEPSTIALRYRNADPFPHAVIDAFLEPKVVGAVVAEFPKPLDMEVQFDNRLELKSASADPQRWGPTVRSVLEQLNSDETLGWLADVTGIPNLISDPTFLGGGLHQISVGGRLGVHADFNRHPQLGLDRRLNLLVYLNEGWDAAWGGDLELWDASVTSSVRTIAPLAGRAVLFDTQGSFHGHPEPLRCPAGVTRKSLALYYYTEPKDPSQAFIDTSFRYRPGTDDRPPRATLLRDQLVRSMQVRRAQWLRPFKRIVRR